MLTGRCEVVNKIIATQKRTNQTPRKYVSDVFSRTFFNQIGFFAKYLYLITRGVYRKDREIQINRHTTIGENIRNKSKTIKVTTYSALLEELYH